MKKILSLLLVITLTLCLFPAQSMAAVNAKYNVTVNKYYDRAFELLDLMNKDRARSGLSPLTMDKDLLEAAMLRAAEIVILREHERPDGTKCFTASSKMYSENIAYKGEPAVATATFFENGFMNSPGHRANILTGQFTTAGIGFVTIPSEIYGTLTYAVQCFGKGTAAAVTKPANAAQTYTINVDESYVLSHGGNFSNVKKYVDSIPSQTIQNEINRAKAQLNKGYAIRLYESSKIGGKTGDHVYSVNIAEITDLITKGWTNETEDNGGNTFTARATPTEGYTVPVYCIIHSSGFHLYTLDSFEVKTHLNSGKGWKAVNNSNPLFYCSNSKGEGVYRAFNPANKYAPQQHFCRYHEYKILTTEKGWRGNNSDKPYWYSGM